METSLLSEPRNQGPVSQVAVVKAGAQTCVQAPSREILPIQRELEGEGGMVSVDFPSFWGGSQLAASAC